MNSAAAQAPTYRERLVPGFGFFAVLLLLAPAVTMVVMPIAPEAALASGIGSYLLIAVIMFMLSPSLRISGGRLYAGRAQIALDQLGEIELLGADALRQAIGVDLDARSYLVVRGWIHRGVRIENTDPQDPAPYWIITTRRPQAFADAIEAARTA